MKNNYVVLVERYNDNYYNFDPGYFYEEREEKYPTYDKAEKELWKYVRYLKRTFYKEENSDYEFVVEDIYYPNARHIIVEINNENELYSKCWRITAKKL